MRFLLSGMNFETRYEFLKPGVPVCKLLCFYIHYIIWVLKFRTRFHLPTYKILTSQQGTRYTGNSGDNLPERCARGIFLSESYIVTWEGWKFLRNVTTLMTFRRQTVFSDATSQFKNKPWLGLQGCQMVQFQNKNPNLGKFWRFFSIED
jgi:hypothetical protein